MDCNDMALVCGLLLQTRNEKEREKFWVHPVTIQSYLNENFTPCTKT
jgi:hypothetical protein